MSSAHYHLVLNHLPIVIPIVGLLVLLGGLLLRSVVVKNTAYCIFILGACCTFPAAFTGEWAEEVLENMPDISHELIHHHAETADVFIVLSYLLGVVSLVTLWASWKKKQFASLLSYVVLAFSVVVLFFAQKTGTSGGEIRHTEIRTSSTNTVE